MKYRHLFAVFGTVTLAGLAIGFAQTGAGAGANVGQAIDANAMMSNTTIPNFDPDAGLRSAQAARDPVKRVEIFAEPGETQLEFENGKNRAQASINVQRMPANLDLGTWPGATISGDYDPARPFVVAGIDLRVDGCAIVMPLQETVLGSPSSVQLTREGARWLLTIQSNDSYRFEFVFDNKTVLKQRFFSGESGQSDADWKIDAGEYGDAISPECTKLQPRRYGARAERKVGFKR